MRTLYRYLIPLCLLLVALPGAAQELAVESFRLLENEISANIAGPNRRIDQNGEVAALIKVQTTETGFVFEGGLLGIVDTKQDVGEIYVWVPRSAKRITIKHPQLGVLRNYAYPVPIESGRTYEMKLISGRVQQIVQHTATEQYFVLNITPANARVTIDDNPVEVVDGVAMARLKMGEHNFTVQAAMHRSEAGIVTITDKKEEMNIRLAPDYGVLQVGSEPQGAEVYIDGAYKAAGITPFTTEWLSPGSHSLEFRLPSYRIYTADVQVTGDGTTQPFSATLRPNFAEVTITVPGDADIYVNDELKGNGSWSGRLNAGLYTVEARKASHYGSSQSVELEAGDTRQITLTAPVPRYGTLDVSSRPVGAAVSIDGKEIGTTPDIFTEVLIGTRTLQLSKAGYEPATQQVTIEEGKTQTLNLSLEKQSAPQTVVNSGAKSSIYLTVSGVVCGKNNEPLIGALVTIKGSASGGTSTDIDGRFEIRCLRGDVLRCSFIGCKMFEKTITASQGNMKIVLVEKGKSYESTTTSSATTPGKTFTVKGVSFTMIPVVGGTFTMGATSEQGSDAGSDEKPTHQVTLSDYYIGETEVTQALWQAVMGKNPSNYKGEQRPVENVSWNDCQKFIKKLNALTGQNFRLPTEAEWEYAARGGNKSKDYKYAGSNTIGDVAWYIDNSNSTHPVGGKTPNELGLYDMSGNVSEWCYDFYNSYSSNSQTNPDGPIAGLSHVLRGGSWSSSAASCRVSNRNFNTPASRYYSDGFRLSLSE
ncbi:MAG: SUMF1/EgtB/PvdO family nonheme iron enzyme [Coprobacter sp.]|nr:SUMF1/EgtB/PvdO family nonheme iron enzyme [Coprobacter sp.]